MKNTNLFFVLNKLIELRANRSQIFEQKSLYIKIERGSTTIDRIIYFKLTPKKVNLEVFQAIDELAKEYVFSYNYGDDGMFQFTCNTVTTEE